MGIISNESNNDGTKSTDNNAAAAGGSTSSSGATFTGATMTGAPVGGGDFSSLRRLIGLDRVDGTVEPYLKAVLEHISRALPGVTYERLNRMSNSYAFKWEGHDGALHFFGILFASTSDPTPQNHVPISQRMGPMLDELRETYAGQQIKLADSRVILSSYAPDMERTFEMANTIVRTFNVTSNPVAKNATIDALVGTEFVADWTIGEARKLENALSPHGVRPRLDVALTLKAKIQHNFGRELKEYDVEYQPLGVIGGYIEIRAPEMVNVGGAMKRLYRPVFNITTLNSVIPLEGVGTILLAAFASTIYNTKFWASQWANLSDQEPNPGLLEEDADNRGKPYVFKSREELGQFIDEFFATPQLAYMAQDGRDGIPGFWRMASSLVDQKRVFGERLSNFFAVAGPDLGNIEIARNIENRFDGVFGDTGGNLTDSRYVDYLYLAAKNGYASMDTYTRTVMLGGSDNPADRAQIVANVTGSFTPTALSAIAVINPDFIKWLVSMTEGRHLMIVDPNGQNEARSFSSFTAGFGDTNGIGSLVSSGIRSRGLGLNSVWNS